MKSCCQNDKKTVKNYTVIYVYIKHIYFEIKGNEMFLYINQSDKARKQKYFEWGHFSRTSLCHSKTYPTQYGTIRS